MKNGLWFQKLHKKFDEFSRKSLKVMLDESSAYVLDEEMYSFDKSGPSNFNFLDFLLFV